MISQERLPDKTVQYLIKKNFCICDHIDGPFFFSSDRNMSERKRIFQRCGKYLFSAEGESTQGPVLQVKNRLLNSCCYD